MIRLAATHLCKVSSVDVPTISISRMLGCKVAQPLLSSISARISSSSPLHPKNISAATAANKKHVAAQTSVVVTAAGEKATETTREAEEGDTGARNKCRRLQLYYRYSGPGASWIEEKSENVWEVKMVMGRWGGMDGSTNGVRGKMDQEKLCYFIDPEGGPYMSPGQAFHSILSNSADCPPELLASRLTKIVRLGDCRFVLHVGLSNDSVTSPSAST